MYRAISDYAVIGNTLSAALVSSDASIDWCCLPRFDSPAVFLRILDESQGGFCGVQLRHQSRSTRLYVPNTNVLRTYLASNTGELEITDFMPVRSRQTSTERGQDAEAEPQIIRLLTCRTGALEGEIKVRPTPGNAIASPEVSRENESTFLFTYDHQRLRVKSSVAGVLEEGDLRVPFHLKSGESAYLVVTCEESSRKTRSFSHADVDRALAETLQYWENWAQSCTLQGAFRDEVMRSALLLKILAYEPSGAIVAAVTNSLPEWIGGKRNWDYRYSWIRDSSLTIAALMKLGYTGEARDFLRFLHRVLPPSAEHYQIMYGLNGETGLQEEELVHLDGYMHSRPVRRGNGAVHQVQMDVFGELAHANYVYWTAPSRSDDPDMFVKEAWPILNTIADYVAANWEKKGSGMWERRGDPQRYTASVGMCWVALDRIIKLADSFHMNAPHLSAWGSARDSIHNQLFKEGFNQSVNAFVQAYGTDCADASVLRLSLFDVVPAEDKKMSSTVAFVNQQLGKNGLLYRYRDGKDGLEGAEGTFTACAFWLAENYALQGRISEAEETIKRVLSCANDVGILSEEINPENDELLGNTPQGFSHIALINAAWRIEAQKHAARI